MKIGGFCEFSLSDFPGRISAVVFTQGCNFRCPFCHNGGLIPFQADPENMIDEEQILDFLKNRRGRLDGVVISGGEPTLQKDLDEFLAKIKELGFVTKLDTNGSRPDIIRQLLKRSLLDYIAMDIKAPMDKYHLLAGRPVEPLTLIESIELIARSGVAHQFRTTFVKALIDDSDLQKIKAIIPEESPFTQQKFIPENALDVSLREEKAVG